MNVSLAHIGSPYTANDPFQVLTARYLERCSSLLRCKTETFKSEEALFAWIQRHKSRTPIVPVLLDSHGKVMTSETLAAWIGGHRQEGVQHIVFAIGPTDGWSADALLRAKLVLSLGSFTLAHAVARLVLAEQLYRATTILTGHPYHSGH
jgi:23S rRNA (pseudouridine1915-N3)-methyltransferase